MDSTNENDRIEFDLILQAIYQKYGYDFRDYAKASIRRRLRNQLSKSNLKTISEMQHKLLNDKNFFDRLLLDLTINVTEMFRDPPFFKAIREIVLSELKKQPFIKVWHAGCSSGEEIYSTAILLKEYGVYESSLIYATDTNELVLDKAKAGIFPIEKMKDYTVNYRKAGGLASFADYYTARYDNAIMDNSLKKNIVFSNHNLVTDSVFGEMDLIMCRNVLIYFNRELQDRVFRLFRDSFHPDGFLCLGSKETVRFSSLSEDFENVIENEKIYRRIVSH
ncbi:MAG: protein-glutamate O-methyltransferase CheR [Candidatus Scalindua sp.]|jgi:chemotaxis protein methyltransferase CheR|nr:protein-glutamate O-methyltransferase CheR [Candidatus Scalindua sp.]MDV5166777.1 protein-glutamate O-methyltransferase CheR [Candidatus Scalindua sp.]